ncbi:pro-Pol polyprotein [Nephila pilipes]|uniref:Pro-Pol polyprotein n=1 Tax=Nephila pilipes TaxID=299642 RepID=A0A8X6TGC9_NEPPI|nr:pro-Pol polyprotein [Nephila pilipes]
MTEHQSYGQKTILLHLRSAKRSGRDHSLVPSCSRCITCHLGRGIGHSSRCCTPSTAGSCSTSLVLQPLPIGQPPVTLYCDVSTDRIRPFVPEFFKREIFKNLHALSHPGIRTSLKLVAERYVWP